MYLNITIYIIDIKYIGPPATRPVDNVPRGPPPRGPPPGSKC